MIGKIGFNNTTLKQQNRGLILKLIATGEVSSRIELARKTGLTKMGISNIVSEFLENGIMVEKKKVQVDGQGRNPVHLSIAKTASKLIGVHVYREWCSVILCDIQLNVIKKTGFALNETSSKNLLPQIYNAIDSLLKEYKGEKIYGIGIGAIGPIDQNQGKILTPPNFYGVHDLMIKKALEERYQMPVYFDGESNCAALAEKYYGNCKNCDDFVYIDLAHGIGSAVVANGKLYANTSGMICELGHTSIDWKGNICECGNRGCMETYVSSNILEAQMQKETGQQKSFEDFCNYMQKKLELREKNGEELNGDVKKIDKVFQDMVEKLSCAVTSFINGFNPQKIIIGHEGYWIPDFYLEMLERRVNARQIAKEHRSVQIEKSYFKAEASVYGCACSLLTAIFDGEFF
jgi:predicted NBD/HSP70 family sugar kinase